MFFLESSCTAQNTIRLRPISLHSPLFFPLSLFLFILYSSGRLRVEDKHATRGEEALERAADLRSHERPGKEAERLPEERHSGAREDFGRVR